MANNPEPKPTGYRLEIYLSPWIHLSKYLGLRAILESHGVLSYSLVDSRILGCLLEKEENMQWFKDEVFPAISAYRQQGNFSLHIVHQPATITVIK
jgi:hypothetical protein